MTYFDARLLLISSVLNSNPEYIYLNFNRTRKYLILKKLKLFGRILKQRENELNVVSS